MTKITVDQMPKEYRDIAINEIAVYNKGRVIEKAGEIPDTPDIPIEDPRKWLKIPDVICVFVDMVGSTKLSASLHGKGTAGAYQLFTGTAIRMFNAFEAPYIDVKGDGIFALFNHNQAYRAIAAAVSVKTFAKVDFAPIIQQKTGQEVGCHIGIDRSTVLVRKIGLKRYGGRTDRQNEVWAGEPVNMASKLASLAGADELYASHRYFARIQNDLVIYDCDCGETKTALWSERDLVEDDRFSFDTAHLLTSQWCAKHGREWCERILELDE